MARVALAPAKINLFLHVGAPGADGYHPLCSLMVFADIGDRLRASPSETLGLDVGGPFGGALGPDADNLVLRAARALIAEAGAPLGGLQLSLEKRLPVAAGLGGGSSDAGAAFRLLREAWSLPVDDNRLEALAAGLGADGAACLWGRPVLAQGRGERLSPVPGLPELHAVLANPRAPVATPEVYARFDAAGVFSDVTPPAIPALATTTDLAAWLAGLRNDLEGPAIAVEARISVVMSVLRAQPETLLARVSGSGGTCFALCAGPDEADVAASRIAALVPDWWVRPCRLGGPWPDPAS